MTSTVNTASVAFHTRIEVGSVDEPLVTDGVHDTADHVRMVRRRV
jgi:hypothetical protein